MNFYRPIHYLFGKYIFETDPKNFPRLASLLAERRLHFWDSEYSEDKVRFSVSVFSADDISKTASETGIPLQMVACKGVPFIFSRYRRRYGLFLGLALGLFMMFYSQLFIWKIEISGNETVSGAEIERALEECGIEVGSFIPRIDVEQDSNRVLINFEKLSSVAISINGTHVTVSVLERTPLPDIVDTQGYYNVIATHDGVIIDIDAADGTPEVREGDTVFAGELLINSFVEGANGAFRPTHARGIVYAAVEESFVAEIPLERITKRYTGESDIKRTYYILGKELPSFSSTESPYEYFDAVASERWLKLFGFIELPIKEFRVVYSEYVPVSENITVEFAETLANDALEDHLNGLGLEVLSCESKFSADEKNGICRLTANAVVKQNIGKEIPFNIDYNNISERLPSARE